MGWVLGLLAALIVVNAVWLARWYWRSLSAAWENDVPETSHPVGLEPAGRPH